MDAVVKIAQAIADKVETIERKAGDELVEPFNNCLWLGAVLALGVAGSPHFAAAVRALEAVEQDGFQATLKLVGRAANEEVKQ
jgi:hypothetical protein